MKDALLFPPAEAAKLLGMSRSRLYEYIDAGAIKSIKHGRSRRIHRDEIQRVSTKDLP
jgi:excisionase family DNA binding protein